MDHEPKSDRRLAAIMATDVVGYSKLMQSDEAGALAALAAIRETTQNQIRGHRGRIANTAGDSVLAEFGSAVEAVSCAMALQQELSSHTQGADLQVRTGIHLGDVVYKGGDLFGTAVNVAARLEGIAQPGGIVVSAAVRDAIAGKLATSFTDLGLKTLKNIQEPVRAYALWPKIGFLSPGASPAGEALPLAGKPSIAVLPFINMSGNPEQQYFSDGITEDIITELSRWHELRVLSRNSSFQYRDKAADAKRIGRELDVHYVVEGSIRQIGDRLRVTAQLVDTQSGSHLWAERYDRSLQEIFAVQDDVVQTIVATLVGRMQAAGADLAKRKPPTSLAAYDCVLRANALPWGDPEADAEARRLYEMAIRLDPSYGLAYALLAQMLLHEWDYDMSGSNTTLDRALEHAQMAVKLDENESICHSPLGNVCSCVGALDLAEHYIRRAVSMNPNNPAHVTDMGALLAFIGKADEGIRWLESARRIDPYFGPTWYWFLWGLAYFIGRRHDEAIITFERSPTRTYYIHAYMAACHAQMGEPVRAKECSAETLLQKPDFSVRAFASKYRFRKASDLEHLLTGLRLAGLPE